MGPASNPLTNTCLSMYLLSNHITKERKNFGACLFVHMIMTHIFNPLLYVYISPPMCKIQHLCVHFTIQHICVHFGTYVCVCLYICMYVETDRHRLQKNNVSTPVLPWLAPGGTWHPSHHSPSFLWCRKIRIPDSKCQSAIKKKLIHQYLVTLPPLEVPAWF